MEQFPLAAREHEHGHEREQHDEHAEEDRPAHGPKRRQDEFARIAGYSLLTEPLLQVVRRVLDHHDGLIDQHADGDGDAGEGHDVSLHVHDARAA
jgi:hypothetical protein